MGRMDASRPLPSSPRDCRRDPQLQCTGKPRPTYCGGLCHCGYLPWMMKRRKVVAFSTTYHRPFRSIYCLLTFSRGSSQWPPNATAPWKTGDLLSLPVPIFTGHFWLYALLRPSHDKMQDQKHASNRPYRIVVHFVAFNSIGH